MGRQPATVSCLRRRWVISIGNLGEFGLIARITERFRRSGYGPLVDLGPGDDAAIVRSPDGRVVATTDLLIEGRHFRRDWSSAYDIGRKAAAQNLADVAAMGARPTALLAGLGLPPQTALDWAEAVCDGLRDEGLGVGAAVVGGDIVRAEHVTLAVTALGDMAGRVPVTRSGARPCDVVAVTGRLGFAAAGVALLTAVTDGRLLLDPAEELIAAHRRPRPPYSAGPAAAALGATAMLDVSDGLVQDLGHIAAASGVRIELDTAALPMPETLTRAAREIGENPLRLVLTGGEDHALAATFPAEVPLPPAWRAIGHVVAGAGEVVVDGRPYEAEGWDHFR